MDLTPLIAPDRQIIESYGQQGFRVSGVNYPGGAIVFPDTTIAWSAEAMIDVTVQSLEPVRVRAGTERAIEILLLGCGARMRLVPPTLRAAFRVHRIVIDEMDSGAACRTYNVLMGEGRRVAAALLPIA
jgi:uncharacterized protein